MTRDQTFCKERTCTVISSCFLVVAQEVQNVQYCACMNPTAGSFSITPRMQRHFATFAVQMPSVDIMRCDPAPTWLLMMCLCLCSA